MPRLIDADRLKADFIGNRYGTQAIEYVIDQQPTVDAEPVVRCKDCSCWCICHHGDNWFCANGTPINTASDFYDDKGHLINNPPTYKTSSVRHGRWLWVDGVRCSICNHKLQTTGLSSYCPECGAKMDEVKDAKHN